MIILPSHRQKFFHELTEAEFAELVEAKYTWGQTKPEFPQPPWCNYPDATEGLMGCWSLMGFLVTGRDHCRGCDLYNDKGEC